jgi:hypothetical protein
VAALEAVQTERVSLVGRSQTARIDVNLADPPQHVEYLTEREPFAVTLVIEEIQETREFVDVPIVVVNTHEDGPEYEATPNRISLSLFGPVRVLDTVTVDNLQPHVEVSVKAPGKTTIKNRPVVFEPPAELTLVRKDLREVTLLRREPQPEPPPLPVPLGPVGPMPAPGIPGLIPGPMPPSTPPAGPASGASVAPPPADSPFELVGPLRALVAPEDTAEPTFEEGAGVVDEPGFDSPEDEGAAERPSGVGVGRGRNGPPAKGR